MKTGSGSTTAPDVFSLLASGTSEAEILEDYPYLTADDIKASSTAGSSSTPTRQTWYVK